jgi:LDH2 family malate/lactate/ureidoglycolate dehydrogenase
MTQPAAEGAALLVGTQELETTVASLFEQCGMPELHAQWAAQALTDADRAGVRSHGLVRLGHYLDAIDRGAINARPTLAVEVAEGAVLRLDADNALGQVAGTWLIEEAVAVARTVGAVVVTMRRGNHLGALGTYVRQAALAGAGALLTQATAANMAPAGGTDARLGNNPFALGLPTPLGFPLVLDLACSAAARGKMLDPDRADAPVPPGWALTAEGEPARTLGEGMAGTLLPFAGHKGAGLATMLGALSGVLSGSAFGQHLQPPRPIGRPRDIGCFAVVFDLARFDAGEGYDARITDYVEFILDGRVASAGDAAEAPTPITVPGRAAEARRVASRELTAIPAAHWAHLTDVCTSRGVAVPVAVEGSTLERASTPS